jgi:hypothetical protein
MMFSIFAPTNNFPYKASNNARRFNRWAFFMPIRQVIDCLNNALSAACLRWYLYIRILITRFAMNYTLAVKRAAVFYCPRLTYNSIMSKTTNPQAELITVQVTPCQLAILNHFHKRDANDYAKILRSVCIAALSSNSDNREEISAVMWLAEAVQDLATEHYENLSFTNSTIIL